MNVKQLGLFILIIFWQKAFAQNIVKEIADIEVAFAADAQKLGVQPAFLKYLDVNSLGFENGMAYNAYTFWQKNNDTGLLAWQAKYIEVAASGKLAYSYGPYQYFAQKTDSIPLLQVILLQFGKRISKINGNCWWIWVCQMIKAFHLTEKFPSQVKQYFGRYQHHKFSNTYR